MAAELQLELFDNKELDSLQEVLRANYQDLFNKSVYVFRPEDDESDVNPDVTESKHHGKLQDEIFTDGEIDEKQKIYGEIQQKKHDEANDKAHQKAELIYFDEPKNDNEKLMNYQYDFLKNNNQEAWGKLIDLSFVVTQRLIWQWLKKHPKVYLDKIAQDEKVSDAVYYVLRRYKENIGWYVKDNFIGALKSGVIHVMLYTTAISKNTFYVDDVNKLKPKE